MSDDKRRSRRVATPIEVECRTTDGIPTGRVRIGDLSAHGAFLDTVNPLPAGTRLLLRFRLQERLVTLQAVVVNEMPQFGMGVGFVDVPPELDSLLRAYVDSQA